MKKFVILFFLFFSSSFSKEPEHIIQANRILSEYAKEMKTKYDLFAFGTGGALMDDVKILDFHFTTSKTLTVPEARKLYVEVVEGLIKKVNSDEKIRPFLHNYPFNINNVEIMICFYKSIYSHKKEYVDIDFISFVYVLNNIISYKIFDPTKGPNGAFVTLHKEPYEEALGIVSAEKTLQ